MFCSLIKRYLLPLDHEFSVLLGWPWVFVCMCNSHTSFILSNKLFSFHSLVDKQCSAFGTSVTHFAEHLCPGRGVVKYWLLLLGMGWGSFRLRSAGRINHVSSRVSTWQCFLNVFLVIFLWILWIVSELTSCLSLFTELAMCFSCVCVRACYNLISWCLWVLSSKLSYPQL